MESTTGVWIAYCIGAGGLLAFKLIRYVVGSKKFNKTFWQSLKDWFFEISYENFFSWVATIGGVWVLGYMYIENVGVLDKLITTFPVSVPTAFLVGVIAEKVIPDIIKAITNKILGAIK